MKTRFTRESNWSLIPQELHGPFQRYIDDGLPPGAFVTSILVGDLFGAVNTANETMRPFIGAAAQFVLLYAPGDSFGTATRVQRWTATGGAVGNGLK
jgi:hypothetical protein